VRDTQQSRDTTAEVREKYQAILQLQEKGVSRPRRMFGE
jgi:hypothetical protein